MREIIFLLISVFIFAVLAKYTDKCVYILFSVIKGGALILIINWVLELFKLKSIGLNLFTAAVCGFLELPGAVSLWIISVFL